LSCLGRGRGEMETRAFMIRDMDFTRDSHGKNMGFSRERHEKHMGKTWEKDEVEGKMIENCGKNDVGFYVGGRGCAGMSVGKKGCFRREGPELHTNCARVAHELRSNYGRITYECVPHLKGVAHGAPQLQGSGSSDVLM